MAIFMATCTDKRGGFDPMCPCDKCEETRRYLHQKHLGPIVSEPRPTYTAADLARAYERGFAEAREMAAKLCDAAPVSHYLGQEVESARRVTLNFLSADIRAMRSPAKKEGA